MKKTKTTYICDSCGKTQERARDLRSFDFHPSKDYMVIVRPDLCADCEAELLETLKPYVGEHNEETLAGFARSSK